MKIAILTPTFSKFSGIDRVVELQAEELIENHKIKLNGELAKLGDKATEEDKIEIEGNLLIRKQKNK